MKTIKECPLKLSSFYMNPHTGSVASGQEWLQDQVDLKFPDADLESLIEVVFDGETGQWDEA
jgi:hypothetical protein